MSVSISDLVLLVGSFFILTAGIGILRLPDTLCRAHALSKAVTLGLSLILLALLSVTSSWSVAIKVGLVIGFHFITMPLAAHIFARYAIRKQEANND